MTNNDELAMKLKAVAKKATPGPWYVHDKPCEDGNYGIDTSDKEFLAEAVVWWGFSRQSIWREEDAKYIAASNPAAILALLEERDAYKKRIAELNDTLERECEKSRRMASRIAELESALSVTENNEIDARCHVAELEATAAHSQRGWNEAHEQESRAEARELQMAEINDALCKLLPDCRYMDPPDGGQVEPLEQVARMVEDYRQRIAELEARTVSMKLPENIPCPGAPQTIWLQTNGDDSNKSSWPENSNDVSWCWEKMFHNDTLYVRADLAAGIKLEVGE